MTELECRKILELSQNYTLVEIKSQYRRKVLQFHPDRNEGKTAQFLLVKKAYEEILIYLDYKSNSKSNYSAPNKTTSQRRTQAEYAYKSRVKRDIDWAKVAEEKRRKYNLEFAENIKIGCLATVIIMLVVVLFGRLFNPKYNGELNTKKEYEQKLD